MGYNENKQCPGDCARTGSHNVVVGVYNFYEASGGFVAGSQNGITGRLSTVTGGYLNVARGLTSHVSGVSILSYVSGSFSIVGVVLRCSYCVSCLGRQPFVPYFLL